MDLGLPDLDEDLNLCEAPSIDIDPNQHNLT